MDPAKNLRLAFDLFEAGIDMYRARLRREQPGISDAEIEAKLREWWLARPDEYPSEYFRVVPWPRRRSG